jgi:hypothetical protein
MSEEKKAPARRKKVAQSEVTEEVAPSRYERNLDAEIEPKEHDGGGSTEADTSDGSVTGDSNPIVAKEGSAAVTEEAPEPAKSVASEDTVEVDIQAENDSTSKTVDEKLEASIAAIESKREPRDRQYGVPEGKIIREGEAIEIPSEKNRYDQDVATEDVWLENTYDGSARPSYKQLAVAGIPVYDYVTVRSVTG